ncbi:hypothetical protein PGTUg99_015318 [Puccinia graminis f. sp. tritici]|uniref:Uncharacterized protein n=1 Tax=Puccinia graminis f. sp. tritici TaxID=56615 RepID=A0A5B0R727_PUCGR|nr:hypothetical protein PGTUg99_015318 [Puccinia graminis f. sp. tritici]
MFFYTSDSPPTPAERSKHRAPSSFFSADIESAIRFTSVSSPLCPLGSLMAAKWAVHPPPADRITLTMFFYTSDSPPTPAERSKHRAPSSFFSADIESAIRFTSVSSPLCPLGSLMAAKWAVHPPPADRITLTMFFYTSDSPPTPAERSKHRAPSSFFSADIESAIRFTSLTATPRFASACQKLTTPLPPNPTEPPTPGRAIDAPAPPRRSLQLTAIRRNASESETSRSLAPSLLTSILPPERLESESSPSLDATSQPPNSSPSSSSPSSWLFGRSRKQQATPAIKNWCAAYFNFISLPTWQPSGCQVGRDQPAD